MSRQDDRETLPASPAAGRERVTKTSPFDPPSDRFEEKMELGRGGMGRVFEAHDVALDRAVAIKQSLGDDHEVKARFEREVRITARLQHPGIVPVLDAGRDEAGRPYYVMRKIEGRPLADLVAEAKTARDRLALVPRVLAAVDAVAYAHARGVIHRDIKPWNVLLGPFGETLVIDWGLARELAVSDDGTVPPVSGPYDRDGALGLTRVGRAYGTPGFMAPEQARGESLDRRADVYALGASLYHVLAGTRPFADVSATQAMEIVAEGQPPDFAKIPDEVPAELTAIATKAMAASASDRYTDAHALAEDLRRFLSGQLVAAHRYTAAELVARWLRRHRLAVAIGAIATILLAVLATLSIRRVIDERDRADLARAAQAARADELLVERADAIVTRDPARALALLKQLPANSEAWARALSVAETAQAFGVGWGRNVRIEMTDARRTRILASHDGKHVAVLAETTLWIVDPALRTAPRALATLRFGEAKAGTWTEDDAALAIVVEGEQLVRVDFATGATKPLDTGGAIARLVPQSDDGRILVLVDGKLNEVMLDGAAPRAVTCAPHGPIVRVERVLGGTVCATANELWFARDGAKPHLLYEGPRSRNFQVSSTSVALPAETEALEWDLMPDVIGAPQRWKITLDAVMFAHESPIGFDSGGAVWLSPDGTYARDLRSAHYSTLQPEELLIVRTPRGLFLSVPGALRLFVNGRSIAVGGQAEAMLSLEIAGSYLLGIGVGGVLRSWNIDDVIPWTLVDENGEGVPIGITDRVVWFQTPDKRLIAHELTEDLTFKEQYTDFAVGKRRCYGPGRDVISREAVDGEIEFEAVDHERKTRTGMRGKFIGVACSPRAAVIALVSLSKVLVLDTRALEATREDYPLANEPRHVAIAERWLAYVDASDTLVRIDRETKAIATAKLSGVKQISVEDTGRVTITSGTTVWQWTGQGPPTSVLVARQVFSVLPTAAGVVVITDENVISLIEPSGRVRSFQTGSRTLPSVARVEPYIVHTDLDQNLAVLDARTGTSRRLPWWAEEAMLSTDGRMVFGKFRGYALLGRTTVPRERAALRAWVHDATNATIEPGSTRLDWK